MPLIDGLAGLHTWAGSFISEKSYVKASFVYNASQVILSSALRYFPEQVGSILKIQRTFIVLDTAFLIADAGLLYKKDCEKDEREGKPKLELSIHIGLSLVIAAIAAVVVKILNNFYLQSAIDLTEILRSEVPSHEIKNVMLTWEKPSLQCFAQWLTLYRSFLHLVLWSFTPMDHRSTYLTNGGLLFANYLQISNLHFLKYQHVSLQSNSSQVTGKVTSSFHFFLPSFKDSYLHSVVQTIHQSCMRALSKLNPLSLLPSGSSRTIYHYPGYTSLTSATNRPAPIWYFLSIKAERPST